MYIVKSAVLLSNGIAVNESDFVNQYLSDRVEYGFIDERGAFHNRKDAMIIAKESGQIKSDEEELYAEDLWGEPLEMDI